ncbi:MAG: succinate--CoA ligase subunit alpha [Thermodesulfobacteriota bacterium]
MKCNEHQSKALFKSCGIPVPNGDLLGPEDAADYRPNFAPPYMVKAQVLRGGRGKAGGIRQVDTLEALPAAIRDILAMRIGEESVPLVRVEPLTAVAREFYLSLSIQRFLGAPVLSVGRAGGVDIEDSDPDNLLIQPLDPCLGLRPFHIRSGFFHLKLPPEHWKGFEQLICNLFATVQDRGLTLAEINPLVLTEQGQWLALDGKVEIDDNAVELQPELESFYQPQHATAQENTAREAGLSYHTLNGRVGLMVNGAGLAMATMDMLNFAGLPAANFLDVGGGANEERVGAALDLLFSDDRVEAILLNIFGGILSCNKVARALALALEKRGLAKPLVARFDGHGAAEGRELLHGLGLKHLEVVATLQEALQCIANQVSPSAAPSQPPNAQPAVPPRSRNRLAAPPFSTTQLPRGDTPVLVQGLTGREGRLHARLMREYGTNVVAGVTPFKGGNTVDGLPVYNSVAEAVQQHKIGASIIFVPARFAPDAMLEARQCEIPWTVCVTEGIPQAQMLPLLPRLQNGATRFIGPNTPGFILPGQMKVGIMPGAAFTPGPVAVLSRSGTLTYECVARLTNAGLGQSVCFGIGGDPFTGSSFVDLCRLLEDDEATKAVLVLGEIGGSAEQDLAQWVRKTGFSKPVVAFVAGQTAPTGKKLGHAGAIIEGANANTDKLAAMRDAGFGICPDLASIPDAMRQALA